MLMESLFAVATSIAQSAISNFCWYCGYLLQTISKDNPPECPICEGEFK
jgi:rubrerythrin